MPALHLTDQRFTVAGIPLDTPAMFVESVERELVPARRGNNVTIPGRRGQRATTKTLDSRSETWRVVVDHRDDDGTMEATRLGRMEGLNDNLDALAAVLARSGLVPITWRRRMDDGWQVLSAEAEAAAAIPVTRYGTDLAGLVIEWVFPDPCWYDEQVTATVLLSPDLGLTMPGNVPAEDLVVRFNGPLTNPRLTNTVFTPSVWLQFNGSIAAGQYVELDTERMTALRNGTVNVIGSVTSGGSARWMALRAGVQTLALTASAGTGNCTVTYRPPYLV